MIIRAAGQRDIAAVSRIYAEAVAWQKKNGYPLFSRFTRAFLGPLVRGKSLYVARRSPSGDIIGVFSLLRSDPEIWRAREKGDALYLHRLAITRSEAGKGFTAAVIAWARKKAAAAKKRFVRLDSWADDPKLCAFYAACGFKPRGGFKIPPGHGLPAHYDGITVNLYEISACGPPGKAPRPRPFL